MCTEGPKTSIPIKGTILFVIFSDFFFRIKTLVVYYIQECKTLITDHVNT
jgi:hypothetical protein